MASRAFHEFQDRAAAQPRPPEAATIEERRAQVDASFGQAPMAEGVHDEWGEVGGVPGLWLRRTETRDLPVLVYLHGGGYRIGSARAWRAFGSHLAAACRTRVLNVDYRLAPENPFPAAVEDAVAVYRGLLDAGEDPGQIILAGDSAGGGLAAAAGLSLREHGLPLPGGIVCLSPWADLTNSVETYTSHADSDQVFSHAQATEAAAWYLAGGDARQPLASPVFGDWEGMPPLLVHTGDIEVLLDDAKNLVERAKTAGVDVRLSIYPEMPHVWHLAYPAFPEAEQAVSEIAAFVAELSKS